MAIINRVEPLNVGLRRVFHIDGSEVLLVTKRVNVSGFTYYGRRSPYCSAAVPVRGYNLLRLGCEEAHACRTPAEWRQRPHSSTSRRRRLSYILRRTRRGTPRDGRSPRHKTADRSAKHVHFRHNLTVWNRLRPNADLMEFAFAFICCRVNHVLFADWRYT